MHNNGLTFVHDNRKCAENIGRDNHFVKKLSSVSSSSKPRICGIRRLWIVSLIMITLFGLLVLTLHYRLFNANNESSLSENAHIRQSANILRTSNDMSSDADKSSMTIWEISSESGVAFHANEGIVTLPMNTMLWGHYDAAKGVFYASHPVEGSSEFGSFQNLSQSISHFSLDFSKDVSELLAEPDHQIICNLDAALLDADFLGNDIANTDNVDAAHCCQMCVDHADCTHWTYVPGSQSCWLKGNTPSNPKIRPGSKLMSGVLNGKRKATSRGLMSKPQHAAIASFELPSCCGETSDKPDTSSLQGQLLNRKTTSPTPWILSHTLTNGDWTEQFPIGNGEIGAFVGGSREIEVIPLSKAEWVSYHLDALKARSGQRSEMASKYGEGRQHLAAGKVSDAISALSNVQNTGLGMFEYLSDLVLKLSPLPFESQSEAPPRTLLAGSNRASLRQWFAAAFQQSTSSYVKTLSLVSEHSLDMKTGISVQRDMAVHVKVSNVSASSVGESEVQQKSRGFRWTSATYRKWFISAVDNVLVGSIKCSASGISGYCLHMAMGLLREHSAETGVPTTQYTVVAAGEGAFHIDMTIVSSPALTVPTTHVALHVRCHKGEAFVAGTTTSKDPGFTDSPLAVCNRARQADILLAVEAIPTIGRDPEQFDASPSTLQKLKTICWDRIRKAERKSQRQVQADHSADVTAAMEQVTVKLASPSKTGISSSPCSDAGNAGRMTFPAPFFGDGCVAPSGHYSAEDPRENQLLPQLYTFGRYLMLTSARRHVPNLQGLWAEGVKSEWNGDYHLNINLQMMYWAAASAFPAGKETQILMPLITFMEELATMGRKTAQDMYSKASESAFFKQHLSEHAWVAHGFTDTTLRGDALADLQWSLCVSCGAWAATHIFDVMLYGDPATIEPSTALKMLEIFRGIADFFEAHLFVLPHDPTSQILYTGPTTSPENSYWTVQQSISNGNGNSKKSNFFNIDLISSPPPPPPKPAMGTAYLTFSPAIDVSVLREFSNAYYLLATWTSGKVSELNQQRFDYCRQAVEFQQLVSKMTNHGLPQTYNSIVPSLNPPIGPGKNPASVLSTSEATSTAQCHRIREYSWASLPSSQVEGDSLSVVENIDVGHRHFSLLHWLYPAQFLPFTNQPNQQQSKTTLSKEDLYSAAKTSLSLKRQHNGGHTSWSAMWEANLWARLGHGEEAFASIKHLMSRYLTSNFLSLHPPLDPHGSKDCVTCYTDEFNHQMEQRKQQLLNQVDHNHQRRLEETDQAMEDPIFHPPPLQLPPLPQFGSMTGADSPPVQTGPSIANGAKPHLRGQPPGVDQDMRHLQQLSPHAVTAEVADVTRRRGFVTDRGEKFQMDGNLGFVAAMHEMLVQSHLPRRLIVLPALPTHWKHGGQVIGVGVRGNARVSFTWRNGNIQALVVSFASSELHPWWSRRIEERPDLPGFYVDEALKSSRTAELTVYSPNRLRIVDKLPQENGGNLCSVKTFAMNEVCENCGSMDHLFPLMQTATVRFESALPSSLPCQLIFCDKSLSIDICQHEVAIAMMK